MPTIDFAQYFYFPALQCTIGEHLGYRQLSDIDKQAVVPILEISHRNGFTSIEPAIAEIIPTSAERPFVFDVSHDPAPPPYIPRDPDSDDQRRITREREAQQSYNAALMQLLDPTDGFAGWRALVSRFRNAIPMIQYTDVATQRGQILRQAVLLSQGGSSIAIRVAWQNGLQICDLIPEILSVLESPDRLLIVVDCGQRRTKISERASFATDAITTVLNRVDLPTRPLIRAVCMSNSFTQSDHDGLREDYTNLDWRLWREARESFPFAFGDYAAMHRLNSQSTFVPPNWRAAVVYPRNDEWLFYRHADANDPVGWREGSQRIVEHARYNPAPRIWGTQIIEQAAAGNLDGIDAPRFWYGAKVNIHIHQQIPFARRTITEYGSDE